MRIQLEYNFNPILTVRRQAIRFGYLRGSSFTGLP